MVLAESEFVVWVAAELDRFVFWVVAVVVAVKGKLIVEIGVMAFYQLNFVDFFDLEIDSFPFLL